jgi:hypothetical protein
MVLASRAKAAHSANAAPSTGTAAMAIGFAILPLVKKLSVPALTFRTLRLLPTSRNVQALPVLRSLRVPTSQSLLRKANRYLVN